MADVNTIITTTFAGGAQVSRLVFGTCSNETLDAIVAALRRIGNACIASGTMDCQSKLDDFKCGAGTNWCCPVSLAETTQPLPCPSYEMRSSVACNSERSEFSRNWGTHGINCYYANTTGALVGASKFDDVSSYCGRTSNVISGGEKPICDRDASAAGELCRADAGTGSQ